MKQELEQNEDMRGYFDNYKLIDPLEPRDAFYVGQTNAAKLYHQWEEGEKIKYVDFTSLNPWCNKMTKTVVGHPCIITENFDDISTYFGLIKCMHGASTSRSLSSYSPVSYPRQIDVPSLQAVCRYLQSSHLYAQR